MSEFPVWVVQHSNAGRTGAYDVYEEVDVRENGVLEATRHDGRSQFCAPGAWEYAGEKKRSAVEAIADNGELCAEGESWLSEVDDS